MPYAVNIADLAALRDGIMGPFLVAPITPNRIVIDANPRQVAGAAIVLECDEDRGAAVVALIRERYPNGRKGTNPHMRCYHSKTGRGGWRRV